MVRAREALAAVGPESSLWALVSGAERLQGCWRRRGNSRSSDGCFVFWTDEPAELFRVLFGDASEKGSVCLSEPGTAFFPLLTIFASPSPDFLGHGEHGWKQNVAPSVWMNVCGNQLRGRGSPHHGISHRVCSGLEKDSKLKPCLMVKIFRNFSLCQTYKAVDVLLWHIPWGKGVSRQADTKDRRICAVTWVRTHDRQVHDGIFLSNMFLQRQQGLHGGKMLHKTMAAVTALMPLLEPASETIT